MTRSAPSRPPVGLIFVLAILAAGALAFCLLGPGFKGSLFSEPGVLWKRLLWPLLRLTFFISLGLFVGQIIEGMGWTNRLTLLARPFMRGAHFSPGMGAAFTTAFVSGTAALSMLMEFHREGTLGRRELVLAILTNTFPSFFLHLPTTFFILLPLVGRAGMLYLLLTFAAAVLRLGVALTAARILLPRSTGNYAPPRDQGKAPWKEVLKKTAGAFRSRMARIMMIVLPVYLIVVIVADAGLFAWLRKALADQVASAFLPVEAFSVVLISLVAEFTSGYAAAGAMLESGALTVFQTVLALLVGNILAAPVRALRHQLPYYMGIFTPRLGLGLMIASQSFRLLSLAFVGGLFAVSWYGFL
ncbi:MAG: nucleoside recognition protein [Desulfobacteraceae bacterium]|jgi:hypothetical protein